VPVLSTDHVGEAARQVRERIGRVGDHEKHRTRRRRATLGTMSPVDAGVRVEKPEAPLGIAAVGGAALFSFTRR